MKKKNIVSVSIALSLVISLPAGANFFKKSWGKVKKTTKKAVGGAKKVTKSAAGGTRKVLVLTKETAKVGVKEAKKGVSKGTKKAWGWTKKTAAPATWRGIRTGTGTAVEYTGKGLQKAGWPGVKTSEWGWRKLGAEKGVGEQAGKIFFQYPGGLVEEGGKAIKP